MVVTDKLGVLTTDYRGCSVWCYR